MKYLDDVETETYQLEVHECDCGFHVGIDFTYLEQVGSVEFTCPACHAVMVIDGVEQEVS